MALKLSMLSGEKPKGSAEKAVTAPEKKVVVPKMGELATVLAAIQKTKGNIVFPASKIPPVRRVPTGLFEFDYYTGGGFPRGFYSIVYGPESSLKTSVALAAVANVQRYDPPKSNKAVWINLEQTLDPWWAEQWGVDTDQLLVCNPSYGEQAVDLTDALVRAEDVGILVVDSIATLVANKEIGQSTETADVGTSSLLIKRLCNKMMYALGEEKARGHYPCVIFINQIRFKLGVMFGDPETMPGGEAQKFLSSLRVRVYGKNVLHKGLNQYVSKEVHCVVKKAKVPVRAVDWKMVVPVVPHDGLKIGQTDSFNLVKGHLDSLGLLQKLKKGYMIQGETGIFPTLSSIEDLYRSSQEFSARLQAMVISASTKVMLVDEPQDVPKDTTPGQVVQEGVLDEPPTIDVQPVSMEEVDDEGSLSHAGMPEPFGGS